ncbi:MAG: sigma-54-dependent Fis family transcriptional regulator [Gemmatimonadota bacterium]|nr:MAG: sigma-54-dependent Fis family transcriptional regulator [Gemmatimonadota bacterium]
MSARILIVDDEKNMRRMLRAILEEESYDVHDVEGGKDALATCIEVEPDVILLDLVMEPGPDGLAVLEQLRTQHPDPAVIMMSGKATLDDAVKATKLGAFQFLEKPLTPERLLTAVGAAVALMQARAENRALRAELPDSGEIVGNSAAMQQVRSLIAQVAPTPSRVLISGESGTGKELIARAIHQQSPRAQRPMVSLNCAAVPRDLLESEMFGHERGAFTGAVSRRHGRFELADKSTLFLDEVGDMHLEAQAKLLRVLEEGTVERVGGERTKRVDVRVIAATNKDLEREVAQDRFREDLFYRLNVFPIQVRPLRDRMDDLPDLIRHLATLAGARCTRAPREFPPDVVERMTAHSWPGNVRELANVIERLTIIGGDGPVTVASVDKVISSGARRARPARPAADAPGLAAALDAYESELIQQALEQANGNVAEAARKLETDRANLYRRMRRLGLSRNDTGVSK